MDKSNKPDIKQIDSFRLSHLCFAEFIDAWRIIPRFLVLLYGVLIYKTVSWYMNLQPYLLNDTIIEVPTTQHAALITAVVGISGAIFGLYANSGRKWEGRPSLWSKKDEHLKNTQQPIIENSSKPETDVFERKIIRTEYDDFPEN